MGAIALNDFTAVVAKHEEQERLDTVRDDKGNVTLQPLPATHVAIKLVRPEHEKPFKVKLALSELYKLGIALNVGTILRLNGGVRIGPAILGVQRIERCNSDLQLKSWWLDHGYVKHAHLNGH